MVRKKHLEFIWAETWIIWSQPNLVTISKKKKKAFDIEATKPTEHLLGFKNAKLC